MHSETHCDILIAQFIFSGIHLHDLLRKAWPFSPAKLLFSLWPPQLRAAYLCSSNWARFRDHVKLKSFVEVAKFQEIGDELREMRSYAKRKGIIAGQNFVGDKWRSVASNIANRFPIINGPKRGFGSWYKKANGQLILYDWGLLVLSRYLDVFESNKAGAEETMDHILFRQSQNFNEYFMANVHEICCIRDSRSICSVML